MFENYEKNEYISAECLPASHKYLREWRTFLNPFLFNRCFLPCYATVVTDHVIEGILSKKSNKDKSNS